MSPTSELLVTALNENDYRRAKAAVLELAAQPPQEIPFVIESLTEALRGGAQVRRRAAQALAELGVRAAPAVPALAETLRDVRWTVREAVALALGRVGPGDETARTALVRCALHDKTALVRLASVTAMAGLGSQAPAALAELRDALQHPFGRVRCRVVRALTELARTDPALVPSLIMALGDSHARVRRTAAEALESLGAAALPAVPALLRRRYDGDPGVEAAAAASLARLGKSLSAPLDGWLGRLTRRRDWPIEDLRGTLCRPDLPAPIRQAFIETCHRRIVWRQRVASPSAAQPEGVARPTDAARALHQTLIQAERSGDQRQEAGWLTAWLWSQLGCAFAPSGSNAP